MKSSGRDNIFIMKNKLKFFTYAILYMASNNNMITKKGDSLRDLHSLCIVR